MSPSRAFPTPIELFEEVRRIAGMIPVDLAGGSPVSKSFLMASMALQFGLKNYVEIGVYRGRSFFPMAFAVTLLGGKAYGIDAYDREAAQEYDLGDELRGPVNAFLESLDFARIHADVTSLREKLGFTATSEIIKATSAAAAIAFHRSETAIDMLHIDGNHDTRHVMHDVDVFVPLVRDGGIVVLDDIDLESVRPASNRLKKNLDLVFSEGRFAVFMKGGPEGRLSPVQKLRLRILHGMAENLERYAARSHRTETAAATKKPTVSVIVITYNHQQYVSECLQGILAQQGDFHLEVVIGDDGSSDRTREVIRSYVDAIRNDAIAVRLFPADRHLGVSRNLERCLRACTGQYVAVCEGDDYWIDPHKLRTQVDFLRRHPECALCFNDFYIHSQESGEFSAFDLQQQLEADVLTTRELIRGNCIGNISCCVYDARHLAALPAGLFDMFTSDWMWNIYYSRFGDIGHLKTKMSVYRRHSAGAWSGKTPVEQARLLRGYIDEYNRFLGYDYDDLFTSYQRQLVAPYPDEFEREPLDLAILDDVFPHPLSAFRLQEFSVYLREFPKSKVYSSGDSMRLLGSTPLAELIAAFKRRNPEHASQLEALRTDTAIRAKVVYTLFLGNAYVNIDRIERSGTPFVFCLYPGGMFGLDNGRSDEMLKRVTASPCFRKVLVTQRVTHDYLIEKRFCSPEQIEFVFGVVTPAAQDGADYGGKCRFGIDKGTLDICFVAHKYTARGIDKGYDMFVDVARRLSRSHDDIQFHVVGDYDERDIDVADIRDRVTFHGLRPIEWFDDFYRDKDVILSPNVPSVIFSGAFDGFPTATCIDAGLRRTAVFCTDELRLNRHFNDGEEIVIVPHDGAAIAGVLESYHREPERLARLGEGGCRKMRQIFGLEAQMAPRLALLRHEIEVAEISRRSIRVEMDRRAQPTEAPDPRQPDRDRMVRLCVSLSRHSPLWFRRGLRIALRAIRSNEALRSTVLRFCPEPVLSFYRRVRASS